MVSTVYRCYAEDGTLLYIGSSFEATERIFQHRNKLWYSLIRYIRFDHYPTRAEAFEAETHAIRREKPLYNIFTRPGKGRKTNAQKIKFKKL